MDTSLGAVSIKVLFPEDIQSPGSVGLRGLLPTRGSESREPDPGKRGSRGAMKPWEGAVCMSDRPMDSGGGPTALIWCSFAHRISCLVTGISVCRCIWCPHPGSQIPGIRESRQGIVRQGIAGAARRLIDSLRPGPSDHSWEMSGSPLLIWIEGRPVMGWPCVEGGQCGAGYRCRKASTRRTQRVAPRGMASSLKS